MEDLIVELKRSIEEIEGLIKREEKRDVLRDEVLIKNFKQEEQRLRVEVSKLESLERIESMLSRLVWWNGQGQRIGEETY